MSTGKASRILGHFPDFYHSENPNNLLLPLVDVFGQILETAEADLIRVLRSHYIDTADNFRGLSGSDEGDLDRIFALYLDSLGGTSRLKRSDRTFQNRDTRQISAFVEELAGSLSPLSRYLWSRFSRQTRALLQRYTIARTRFPAAFSRPAIVRLLGARDPLTAYIRGRFSPATQQALDGYDGSRPVPIALCQALAEDLNRLLRDPSLKNKFASRQPSEENAKVRRAIEELERAGDRAVTGDDLARLNRILLEAAYNDFPTANIPTEEETRKALVEALNSSILPDPELYEQNRATFAELSLPAEFDRLRAVREETGDKDRALLESLNRLLLETAYPIYLEKSYAPYRERARHIIAVLKNGASTKEGIIDIAAANLGIRTDGLEGKVKPWESFLFDLPLDRESDLGALAVSPGLRQEFRARGIGIAYNATVAIDESRNRWTITDINSNQVYAIYKNSDRLSVYRSLIRVIEFFPEPRLLGGEIHPKPEIFAPGDSLPLPLVLKDIEPNGTEKDPSSYAFTVTNPNALATIAAIQIRIGDRRKNPQEELSPLKDLTITHTATGKFVRYKGSLKRDDVILFLPDGNVLIRGVAIADPETVLEGSLPELPVGESTWTIEAKTGLARAAFDTTLFDFCRFDEGAEESLNTERANTYRLAVKVIFDRLIPGSFTVRIPWELPGYTDRFAETENHPRHQIGALIEKVKAAGVRSAIVYEKSFLESQEIEEGLTVERSPFLEVQEMSDRNFSIESQKNPEGLGIFHDINDKLITSAIFDYTYFDSLNTFG